MAYPVLGESYTRREAHHLLAPQTSFTPQAGTWGLQGIVPVTGTRDTAFFVTFGRSQAGHEFVEGISDDGVLEWQSQPAQTLSLPSIRKLIEHQYASENIFLFLRTKDDAPYQYLGRLGYLEHDPARERPVYFKWLLMDFDVVKPLLEAEGFEFTPPLFQVLAAIPEAMDLLELTLPPEPKLKSSTSTQLRTPTKAAVEREQQNRALGLQGEKLVVLTERERLAKSGRNDLAGRVEHCSLTIGDGLGFDVSSFDLAGNPIYIEVKTTRYDVSTPFFLTRNELATSERIGSSYRLYRVHGYDPAANSGKYYEVAGSLADQLSLEPTVFSATIS